MENAIKVVGITYDISDEEVMDYGENYLNLSSEEVKNRFNEIKQQIIEALPTEMIFDYDDEEDFSAFVETILDKITNTVGFLAKNYNYYIFL